MFSSAKTDRVYENICRQIEDAVISGELKPGDRLPSERELKDIFQVSRRSLREALRVLEHKGLIEIRIGASGGAYVKPLSPVKVRESLELLIRARLISLKELAEFRGDLESLTAKRAARKARPEDVKELRHLLDQAKKCLKNGPGDWDDFIQVDKKIHLAMARISGNPIHLWVLETVHDNINQYFDEYLPKDAEHLEENYQDLKAMVQAVAEADQPKAFTLAQEHVCRFNSYMQFVENRRGLDEPRAGQGGDHD